MSTQYQTTNWDTLNYGGGSTLEDWPHRPREEWRYRPREITFEEDHCEDWSDMPRWITPEDGHWVQFEDGRASKNMVQIHAATVCRTAHTRSAPNWLQKIIDLAVEAAKHGQVQKLGRLHKLMVSRLLTAEPSDVDALGQIVTQVLINMAGEAAKHGQVSVLKWLHTETCLKKSYLGLAKEAAKHGQVPVLEWLHTITCLKKNHPMLTKEAAKHGHVQVLEWIRDTSSDFMIYLYAFDVAAKHGHVHVLEWMQTANLMWENVHLMEPYPFSQIALSWEDEMYDAIKKAAWRGNKNVLEWMHKHSKWPARRELLTGVAKAAAINNNVEILEWMRNAGLKSNNVAVAEFAVIEKRVQVLDWLCLALDVDALRSVSDNVMKCLVERGMTFEVCKAAGREGSWLEQWRVKQLIVITAGWGGNKPRLPPELWEQINEDQ